MDPFPLSISMTDYLDIPFEHNDADLIQALDEIPLWSAPFGLRLLDAVRYRRGISALDIGFGTGFPLLKLAMRFGEDSNIYGVDPWMAAVAHTRAKAIRYGITNVQLITGCAEELPLPDGSMELIVSNNGINNVQDLERALSECARVCRTGAQFLATMNLDTTMLEFYDILQNVLDKRGLVDAIQAMKSHIRAKRRPLEEVRSLLEGNGLAVRKIVNDNFRYKFTTGSALFRHFFIRLAFLSAWKEIVTPPMQREVFAEVEERMNEKAAREGSVQLSVPFVLIECERT